MGSDRTKSGRGLTMPVHRLQSPFQHWFRGLLAEVLAFALFIFVVFALSVAVSLVL
jgi:hypothetical protein